MPYQHKPEIMQDFNIEKLENGKIHYLGIPIVHDSLGQVNIIPVIVAKGIKKGPVFGITAAVHGNELNGIRVIQQLFRDINPKKINGTIVGCPVINLPGYLNNQRLFIDGQDLNRLMPGNAMGNIGEFYAYRIMTKLICHFNYLVDLHTASFGRVNSLYVRANLTHQLATRMALLQSPEIIVHNDKDDGTLRRAAMKMNIPSIAVEVGNPQRFQNKLIMESLIGIKNLLIDLKILDEHIIDNIKRKTVICSNSYWIYSQHGGVIDVYPSVTDIVQKGDIIAHVHNIYGDQIAEYIAPEHGIIVGRSTNPVCYTGARIAHLGIIDRNFRGHIENNNLH